MAIVAPKGHAKSPALGLPLRPIDHRQSKAHKQYAQDMKSWMAKLENCDPKSKNSVRLEKPEPPRYYFITGATEEGVRSNLLENQFSGFPGHVLNVKDELNALFSGMNQYKQSGGSEKEFYLTAYDGSTIVITNKSEKFVITDATMSIVGGIQPKIFKSAFSGDNVDNGLFDRFLFAVNEGFPKNINPFNEVSYECLEEYKNCIYNLMDAKVIPIYEFEKESKEVVLKYNDIIYLIGKKHGTTAFAKWRTNYFKLILNLVVLWNEDSVKPWICEKAGELILFYINEFIKSVDINLRSPEEQCKQDIRDYMSHNAMVTHTDLKRMHRDVNKGDFIKIIKDLEEEKVLIIESKEGDVGRKATIYESLIHES